MMLRFPAARVLGTLLFLLLSLPNPFMFNFTQLTPSFTPLTNLRSTSNPIQSENKLPGTSAWQLSNPAPYDPTTFDDPAIEGYAWTTSAAPGDIVQFSVSTTASSFMAEVYRLGWYQGKGGRFIQRLPTMQGHAYSVPPPDLTTGLIEANWPLTFTLRVGSTWVSGMYMVKLTASNGFQSYVPFVVRSSRPSDFAFIQEVNTDEAYNAWGGTSLYYNYTKTFVGDRAYKVSFDRPFLEYTGGGQFFEWEYPMVRWLERNGYDVSYLSDLDVQNNPYALLNHRAVLIVGHSEYWSRQMRLNLEAAVNNGVNLGVFGANDIYRQIRYEPRSSGTQPLAQRVVVCYKSTKDPYYRKVNSLVTIEFRNDPLYWPEQSLLGSMYGSFWDNNKPGFPWVVADASSWVFAGTGLKNGDSLPGLVGYEYDKVNNDYPTPPGLDVLSASPIVDIYNMHDASNATVYTAASGARVFNAGTIRWSWGLDDYPASTTDIARGLVNKNAQKITANILHNFLTVASQPQLHAPAVPTTTQANPPGLVLPILSSVIIFLVLYASYQAYLLVTHTGIKSSLFTLQRKGRDKSGPYGKGKVAELETDEAPLAERERIAELETIKYPPP